MKFSKGYCCVFFSFVVLVIVIGCLLFKPVAQIGNTNVSAYEFYRYATTNKINILENMAEDVAFKELITELGVSVTDDEIEKEKEKMKYHKELSEKELTEFCMKTILHQKALDKIKEDINISAEDAREYYNVHKSEYGDEEPDFEIVKIDMQSEMGAVKYEEMLEKIRSSKKVQIP